MPRKKILSVVGTRPNFMKIGPIQAELAAQPDEFEPVLVHTGQHYDAAMSDIFFEELGIAAPDHMLDVGSGTHTQQTARVMERLAKVGFNQNYTYFAWRQSSWELREYFTDLSTRTAVMCSRRSIASWPLAAGPCHD